MATYGWGTGTSVAEGLSEDGYQFEFFEAVRLLEQMAPDRTAVGEGMAPDDEAVRFRTRGTQAFTPSDVVDVELPDNGQPAEVTVSFMSLTGSEGPLPEPYTELLDQRVQRGDTAMRDFFDLLTRRFVALLYRSRRRHHVGMESASPDRSTVARYLRSIAGLGLPSHAERSSVPDHALLRYADLLNQHPSSAHGLEVLLGDYFDVGVSAEPLVGRWVDLDEEQYTKIGALGQSQVLGQSAVLGTRAWDQEGRVRIQLTTSEAEKYLRFLPGRDGHRALVDLAQLYLARGIDFDLDVQVPGEEIPQSPVSGLLGPRLGRDAALGQPSEPQTTPIRPRTFPPELEVLRVPLFSQLSPDQLRTVVDDLPRLERDAETHVVRQGRPAEALYVIARGAADIVYQSPESEESTVLASLEPGDVFGDESTVHDRRYQGSLVTTASTTLFKVTRERLDALMNQYPAVERALEATYRDTDAAERQETEDEGDAEILARTTEPGFETLAPDQWRLIVREGRVLTVDQGTALLRPETRLDAFVLLVEGVVVDRAEDVRHRASGYVLNAHSLLRQESVDDVVVAGAQSRLLVVTRPVLRRLVQKYPFVEDALRIYFHRTRSA